MGVYDFTVLEIGDVLGINTDLGINPNSIPYPVEGESKLLDVIVLFRLWNCARMWVTSGLNEWPYVN